MGPFCPWTVKCKYLFSGLDSVASHWDSVLAEDSGKYFSNWENKSGPQFYDLSQGVLLWDSEAAFSHSNPGLGEPPSGHASEKGAQVRERTPRPIGLAGGPRAPNSQGEMPSLG